MKDRWKGIIWAVGSIALIMAVAAIVVAWISKTYGPLPDWAPFVGIGIALVITYPWVKMWEKKVDWIEGF